MVVSSKRIAAPDLHPVRRALISVSDKTGLIEFAQSLIALKIDLISTGGTAKTIANAGLPVTDISDITNFPEIMDGRVKTLHPNVHGGLLSIRDDSDHVATMIEHGIPEIDLAVITLYPFEEVRARGGDAHETIENIDIGGPAMIRAAAKNHAYVTVVTDPSDYEMIADALAIHDGHLPYRLRQEMAAKAFARTAAYDAMVSNWFAQDLDIPAPHFRAIGGKLLEILRYGENPHQTAAFYKTEEKRFGVASAKQVQGKQLSYNNINDTDAAFELVSEFDPNLSAAVAIIKHANPCGVAHAQTLKEAYLKALACDATSAFGGIIAVNRTLDLDVASEIVKTFTEVIIAPHATSEAIALIGSKKNLRLLITDGMANPRESGMMVKTVAGGLLVQTRDNCVIDDMDLKIVTKRAPTATELEDLRFAFRVAKHVKSNAIVYVKNGATVGVGAGQMSRVDSARIAARKAQDAAENANLSEPMTKGSVVASDAFFPFADGLLSAINAGATAVIQPGGSMRDDEVIACADAADIAMVFTGVRHFRH